MPSDSKPGIYTLKAVLDSGPLAGQIACEKKVTVVSHSEATPSNSHPAGPLVNQPAPAWKLAAKAGASPKAGVSPLSSSQFRGKVVLLNFWATWCAPCVAEFPQLEKFHQSIKNQGGTIVALSVANDPPALVQSLTRRQKVTFPVATDSAASGSTGHGVTFNAYKIGALPRHVVIDKQGIVRYHGGNLEEAMRITNQYLP